MTLNVLVTGAFGFLGRHVALAYARAGYNVRGIGHGSFTPSEMIKFGLSDWRESDINYSAMVSFANSPDLIIHCAGSSSVSFSMLHPLEDFDRTVVTTKSILEYACKHCPKARILFASSASVYGNSGIPIKITAQKNPVSIYGRNKKIAEELLISYARRFGLSVVIVRFFSLYGVGLRKQLLWDACMKFSRCKAIFGGTGTELRDWLHIDDATRLLLTASVSEFESPLILNGATSIGIPNNSVIKEVAYSFNYCKDIIYSGISRLGDPQNLVADITESKALGWSPNKVFEEELANYVEWFKAGAS